MWEGYHTVMSVWQHSLIKPPSLFMTKLHSIFHAMPFIGYQLSMLSSDANTQPTLHHPILSQKAVVELECCCPDIYIYHHPYHLNPLHSPLSTQCASPLLNITACVRLRSSKVNKFIASYRFLSEKENTVEGLDSLSKGYFKEIKVTKLEDSCSLHLFTKENL